MPLLLTRPILIYDAACRSCSRWIARRNRWRFGRAPMPPGTRRVRWVFLRALGVVYLVAFTSLGREVIGLYGRRGIAPIALRLKQVETAFGQERYRVMPSLFWRGSSDAALVRACRVGQLASVALLFNFAPRAALAALWAVYLSFVATGSEFLSYQWDALLLETTLHAWAIAPSGFLPKVGREDPSWLGVIAMRWLAFRLQFESGLAKLRSGDPTWKDRTALAYHFETQPLPTPLGWHAQQAPRSAKRFATRVTLFCEYLVPFLTFTPRPPRHAGFWVLSGLQGAIALTGNYGFFNLLTVALNLWLLDDTAFGRAFPSATRGRIRRSGRLRRFFANGLAVALLALTGSAQLAHHHERTLPRPVARALRWLQPFHSINTYGLFSVMTTARDEIAIEGSDDGVVWQEYQFRYKPGATNCRPRWVEPHQPRLDWQMWFAALGPPPLWFVDLMARLLEGSPDVLALFEACPFREHPPQFLRARLYEYRFTDRETRQRTGAWWRRDLLGDYFPVVSLSRSRTGERTGPDTAAFDGRADDRPQELEFDQFSAFPPNAPSPTA